MYYYVRVHEKWVEMEDSFIDDNGSHLLGPDNVTALLHHADNPLNKRRDVYCVELHRMTGESLEVIQVYRIGDIIDGRGEVIQQLS